MMLVLPDFIRRHTWLWLGQFFMALIFWSLPGLMSQKMHLECVGAVAISFDLMRGLARSSLGWPVSQRSLAGQLWIGGVLVPTLVSALATAASTLIGNPLPLEIWALHIWLGFGIAGTFMLLLSRMPGRASTTRLGQIHDAICGGLWGLGLSGSMMMSIFFMYPSFDSISLYFRTACLLTPFAIWSIFTTQSLIQRRALTASAVVPHPTTAISRETATGWKLWLRLELRWHGLIALMMLFMALISYTARFFTHGAFPAQVTINQFTFVVIFSSLFFLSFGVGSVRALRALPISHRLLILLFLLRPFICSILGCLYISLLNGATVNLLLFHLALGAIVALGQAVVIHYLKPWLAILLFMVCSSLMLPLELMGGEISFFPSLLLFVIIAGYATAAWLIHHSLRHSPRLYRAPAWFSRFTQRHTA